MDLLSELGPLAFASRLKRLSDRLMRDVRNLYRRLEMGFDPRWFLFICALHRRGRMSIADLARDLGFTHTAIHQLAAEIAKTGLITSQDSKKDKRQRLLSLTEKGRATVSRLEPVWEEIRSATQSLLNETHMDVLGGLGAVEASLDGEDMFRRVWFKLDKRPALRIVIEDYRPAYRKYFESLNREWLETYFADHVTDEKVFMDPRCSILKPGGAIFFARLDGEVVGTCALRCHGKAFVLCLMAVTPKARGLGVGRRLMEAALGRARAMGLEFVTLRSSPRLEAANALFEKFGFERMKSSPGPEEFFRGKSFSMRCHLRNQEVAG